MFRKPLYACLGYNTVFMGSGRKEFHPKKPRSGLEDYFKEAVGAVASQMPDPSVIDEAVVGNFVSERFCHQGNLGGFFPMAHSALRHKPCIRVEGACDSGGLALVSAARSVLSDLADVVLCMGLEVQNTVKALYGADYLAAAGWYAGERKNGHAFFFPDAFSKRAGAYHERFGKETARAGMAKWYANAIEAARRNPKAQEHHNTTSDLIAAGLTPPNPKTFCEHINFFDCSKVSDGASALVICSKEGLAKLGVSRDDAVEIMSFAQVQEDLTAPPEDPTRLTTCKVAAERAYKRAGIGPGDLSALEVHDCFTVAGIMAVEAAGFADHGGGAAFVREGMTRPDGVIPTNATGGLIGFGHPTGATGVRQAVDLLHQLTGKAGGCQVTIHASRPYGLMSSMGGNDKTVVAMVLRKQG